MCYMCEVIRNQTNKALNCTSVLTCIRRETTVQIPSASNKPTHYHIFRLNSNNCILNDSGTRFSCCHDLTLLVLCLASLLSKKIASLVAFLFSGKVWLDMLQVSTAKQSTTFNHTLNFVVCC